MEKIIELIKKYKSVIAYLFFGGCTTLVNIIVYWISAHPCKLGVIVSSVLAWIFAVLFAYATNRTWVFESKVTGVSAIVKEMASFFACRIATGLVDLAIMYVCVDLLQWNDLVMKIIANVIVIILNYVASKLLVFKEKTNE